jgi:hypothetical protein
VRASALHAGSLTHTGGCSDRMGAMRVAATKTNLQANEKADWPVTSRLDRVKMTVSPSCGPRFLKRTFACRCHIGRMDYTTSVLLLLPAPPPLHPHNPLDTWPVPPPDAPPGLPCHLAAAALHLPGALELPSDAQRLCPGHSGPAASAAVTPGVPFLHCEQRSEPQTAGCPVS